MSTSILVVCAGNICRSPAAEAAIRDAAARHDVEVSVDSAGTGAWNVGSPPTPQSVEAGARVGLTVEGRARRVIPADFDRFDIIVVMDRANLRDVTSLARSLEERAKVRLFRTYDPSTGHDEVPDPYGCSDEVYDEMVAQVRAAAEGLVDSLMPTGPLTPIAGSG